MVENRPTDENGPLHDPAADTSERKIVASYASQAEGQAAVDSLVGAGIDAGRISLTAAAADPEVAAAAAPADDSIVGRIRHAVMPIEHHAAMQGEAAAGHFVLTVTPKQEEVEAVVQTIQASNPALFDADLERWRNG